MPKATHTKKKIEQDAWYRPNKNAPAYWQLLIGRSVGVVRRTKTEEIHRIEFKYRANGEALKSPEYFDFTSDKLELVKLFSALVRRANPPRKVSDEELGYEVVKDEVAIEQQTKWHQASMVKDEVYFIEERDGFAFCIQTPKPQKLSKVLIRVTNPRRIVVGPNFTKDDMDKKTLQETYANRYDCLIAKIPATDTNIFAFPKNSEAYIRSLK